MLLKGKYGTGWVKRQLARGSSQSTVDRLQFSESTEDGIAKESPSTQSFEGTCSEMERVEGKVRVPLAFFRMCGNQRT